MTRGLRSIAVLLAIPLITMVSQPHPTQAQELNFDHNHTNQEVVDYLNAVVRAYPEIARLHTIGQSYEGRDLLVLEVTNQATGDGLSKPGFWIDGNLHASEVMGAEVTLKNIDVLVKQYGSDPFITNLVDTRTIYLMPKMNPDGSDYYLMNPDGMRSSVRPHDSDRDGVLDDDPPEDLNGDRNITQMRVRDVTGPFKTSPDDPRLMVRVEAGEPGEWRVYSEGIDNDNDGNFNEDGVGGLDINRNWPGQWQQEHVQYGSGPYALSEPETRAVADFLFSHPNVTGIVNHHMAGNFVYRPPTAKHFDPVTGDEIQPSQQDEAVFRFFGNNFIIYMHQLIAIPGAGNPVFIAWSAVHTDRIRCHAHDSAVIKADGIRLEWRESHSA